NEHNHKEKTGDTKSSQSEKNQGKSSHGKQANNKSGSEKSSKKSNGKLKKSTNASQEKSKNPNQKATNPKKRKRPHVHSEELEDDQYIITFRGEENIEEDNNQNECQLKASEIKEVQSRFENIVWSEDKFPKK